jgi:hypothetical protein
MQETELIISNIIIPAEYTPSKKDLPKFKPFNNLSLTIIAYLEI